MKNLFSLFIIVIAVIFFNACKKSSDFIADNTTPTPVGFRPVSTNPLRDIATTTAVDGGRYFANSSFTTELQFFSESPVKEINLFSTIGTGARAKVNTWPYAPALSKIKRADTLLINYAVPAVAIGTKIKLEYEILNVNTLNLIRTVTITLK
ncbi:MAG: hypothetical protein ABIN01_15870 [Ferruginibacter sp.]